MSTEVIQMDDCMNFQFHYPLDFQAEGVLSLLASVRLTVRKIYLVRAITLSQIWAGITKFAPYMYTGILSAGIENGGHWPWPSRSILPFLLWIQGNSASPHGNSQQIWVKITKLAPSMHPMVLLFGIENGGQYGHFGSEFWKIRLIHAITLHRFGLESPNAH